MSPRKKNAEPRRPVRHKTTAAKPPLPPALAAMLMVGDEPVLIDHEENDNALFMSELIDTD